MQPWPTRASSKWSRAYFHWTWNAVDWLTARCAGSSLTGPRFSILSRPPPSQSRTTISPASRGCWTTRFLDQAAPLRRSAVGSARPVCTCYPVLCTVLDILVPYAGLMGYASRVGKEDKCILWSFGQRYNSSTYWVRVYVLACIWMYWHVFECIVCIEQYLNVSLEFDCIVCILRYFTVFECIFIYKYVFECIWMYLLYRTVFVCISCIWMYLFVNSCISLYQYV